jgi:hypothetical protein
VKQLQVRVRDRTKEAVAPLTQCVPFRILLTEETSGPVSTVTHPEHEPRPASGAPSHGALLKLEVHDWASVSPLAPRWPGDHCLIGGQRIRAPAPECRLPAASARGR